jgi:DNA-binding IclR family transcriptional regulator
MSVLGVGDLKSEAIPFPAQAAAETGETSQLIVLEGAEIVFVAAVDGGHVIRAASRVGARVPAHATAAGKCLLARLSEDDFQHLFPSARLAVSTAATVRSRRVLSEELGRVRSQGYAINDGESEDDLAAVSAPVVDARGTAHGAISVSGRGNVSCKIGNAVSRPFAWLPTTWKNQSSAAPQHDRSLSIGRAI